MWFSSLLFEVRTLLSPRGSKVTNELGNGVEIIDYIVRVDLQKR